MVKVLMDEDTIKRAIAGCLASNDLVLKAQRDPGSYAWHGRLSDATTEASFVVGLLEGGLKDAQKQPYDKLDMKLAPSQANYNWQNAEALRVELAKAKGDVEFYKGLHKNQADSIKRLYAQLDEAKAKTADASSRATAAEEELAIQSWRAEENLKSSLEYQRQLRCCEDKTDRVYLAEQKAHDMEERALNAEVNAKYYWKEMERLKRELANGRFWVSTNAAVGG